MPSELDRLAGDGAHRQRGAAAGVAVELGEDDAVEVDRCCELLGDVDGVLAGHGVDHQQDVVRLDRVADAHELAHQLVVDVQAAGGVDDDHVAAVGARTPTPPRAMSTGSSVRALRVDRHAHAARRASTSWSMAAGR